MAKGRPNERHVSRIIKWLRMEGLEFCFIPVDWWIISVLPFYNQNKFPQHPENNSPAGFFVELARHYGYLYSASQTLLHFLSITSSALSFLPKLLCPMSNVPHCRRGAPGMCGGHVGGSWISSPSSFTWDKHFCLTELGEIPYLHFEFTVWFHCH